MSLSRIFQSGSRPENNSLKKLIMEKQTVAAGSLIRYFRTHNQGALNEVDPIQGVTPLIAAISQLDDRTSGSLIFNGANVSLPTFKYTTHGVVELFFPSLMAASYSFTKCLEIMLNQEGFNINNKTEKLGFSVLYFAIQHGRLNAVHFLFLKKREGLHLDVNIQANDGSTPLHIAIYNNYPRIVEALLDFADIDANLTSIDGSIIQLALNLRRYDIVQILLNSGKVDLFSTKNRVHSTLTYVQEYGDERIKEIFSTYIQEHFIIPYPAALLDKIKNSNDMGLEYTVPMPDLDEIGAFPLLQKLQTIKPNIRFIQFPQNNLCYEDGTAKIYVLRLSNNDGADTAFIDVYDYNVLTEFIQKKGICPLTRKPISNDLNFSAPDFSDRCYLLGQQDFLFPPAP